MHRDIAYTVYLLDVLEESHTAQLLLDYYCTRIEVSVLRGGGDVTFLSFFPGGECLISCAAKRLRNYCIEAVCVSVCGSVHDDFKA